MSSVCNRIRLRILGFWDHRNAGIGVLGESIPLMGASLFNAFVTLAVFLLAARALDPIGFGKYTIIFGVVNASQTLLVSGIATWGTREIALDHSMSRELYAAMSRSLAVLSSGLVALSIIVLYLYPFSNTVLITASLLIVQGVVRAFGDISVGVLVAKREAKRVATANTVGSLAILTIGPILLLTGGGLIGLACTELAGSLSRTIIYIISARRSVERSAKLNGSRIGFKAVIKATRSFWLAQSSFAISNRLQTVAIGLFSPYFAGLYALTQRILESTLIVMVPVTTVLVPQVAIKRRSEKDSIARVAKECFRGAGFASAFGLTIGIAVIVVGNTVMLPVVGDSYEDVVNSLWLLAAVIALLFASQVFYAYLLAYEQESFVAVSSWLLTVGLVFGMAILATQESYKAMIAALAIWYLLMNVVWGAKVLSISGVRSPLRHFSNHRGKSAIEGRQITTRRP